MPIIEFGDSWASTARPMIGGMSDLLLAAPTVCALWLVCFVWALNRRIETLPGLVCGSIYLVMALWGGILWNWSRENNGAGLTDQFTASTSTASPGAQAFLVAAAGCFLGALLVSLLVPSRGAPHSGRSIDMEPLNRLILVMAVLLLVLWLVGQGPSIMERSVYLQTDGSEALGALTGLLGPIIGATAFGVSGAWGKPWGERLVAQLAGGAWFVLLCAVGSRLAVLFPVILLVHLLQWAVSRRTALAGMAAAIGSFLCAHWAMTAFVVSQIVRGRPHGLTLWVTNWTADETPGLTDLDSWIAPLQRLVSSVAASSVITDYSVAFHPPLDLLVRNANPLPSSLLGNAVNPYSAERLWPLEWVPLSLVGEWYGATGPVGQLALFTGIAITAGWLVSAFRRVRFTFGMVVTFGFVGLFTILSIQYPSRMAFRGLSLMLALPFGLLVPRAMALIQPIFRKESTK